MCVSTRTKGTDRERVTNNRRETEKGERKGRGRLRGGRGLRSDIEACLEHEEEEGSEGEERGSDSEGGSSSTDEEGLDGAGSNGNLGTVVGSNALDDGVNLGRRALDGLTLDVPVDVLSARRGSQRSLFVFSSRKQQHQQRSAFFLFLFSLFLLVRGRETNSVGEEIARSGGLGEDARSDDGVVGGSGDTISLKGLKEAASVFFFSQKQSTRKAEAAQ